MIEGRHYQNAYITRDIEQAVTAFTSRADVRKLIRYEGSTQVMTPVGPRIQASKLAFIWVGDLQYELIQPTSGEPDIYNEALPDHDGPLFHHVCMRVDNWDDFRKRVDRQPLPVVIERNSDPSLKFLYLDARKFLGHYLEYTWMSEQRWSQMGGR